MRTNPTERAIVEVAPTHEGFVVVDDHARLAYQVFGEAGPPVVYANGIGIRFPGGHRQLADLSRRYRVICWDYRGLGASRLPHRDASLSMPRHAKDVLAILDHLEIERAVFMGWSMGVQVTLEASRLAPDRVTGIAALFGSYGAPIRARFGRWGALPVEVVLHALRRYPFTVGVLLDLAVAIPELTTRIFRAANLVGRDIDRDAFALLLHTVGDVDPDTYTRTFIELIRHDASDWLSQIRCPTLIVSASNDLFSGPKVGRQMAKIVGHAEYRELSDATHFAPVEKPAELNRWLHEFIERVLA